MKHSTNITRLSAVMLIIIGLAVPAQSWARGVYRDRGYPDSSLVNQLRFAYDEDDREDAAKELGKIGDPRALPALRQAASYDLEKDVRKKARKAIEKIERRCRKQRKRDRCLTRPVYEMYRPFPWHPVICQTRPHYYGPYLGPRPRW